MEKKTRGVGSERGQVLAGVILLVMILLIMIPAMVQWVQIESKASVKDQKATTAFNLASAAVERGYWKVKSSTANCNQAIAGTVIAGYNFDTTYKDVAGGTYRIKLSSASGASVTIVGEGRDAQSKETRAISAVFKNQTIYSPLMATQGVAYTKAMCPHWGPIMSQGDINLNDDGAGNWYFPRKYAKGVVSCNSTAPGTCTPGGATAHARDANGLTPPNTDNVEWWSNYQYVPDLPLLDFAALRSSAAATGTLNVYGCKLSAVHTDTQTWTTVAGAAPWDKRAGCANVPNNGDHTKHFGASYNHLFGARTSPAANSYVWYYDGDVILAGDNVVAGNSGIGLHGTLIVRGNLTLDANGDYNYTGNVPVNAWAEYGKLTKTTNDTGATGEYPADNGFQKSKTSINFGTDSICTPASFCGINTVGMRGFTYVGGTLTITDNGFMDFNGAVWVNGSVVAAGASASHYCGIFYDDQLTLPTLNVVLTRQSWKETSPSAVVWP
jgi:Tfp pilus assembly protein PilX